MRKEMDTHSRVSLYCSGVRMPSSPAINMGDIEASMPGGLS